MNTLSWLFGALVWWFVAFAALRAEEGVIFTLGMGYYSPKRLAADEAWGSGTAERPRNTRRLLINSQQPRTPLENSE